MPNTELSKTSADLTQGKLLPFKSIPIIDIASAHERLCGPGGGDRSRNREGGWGSRFLLHQEPWHPGRRSLRESMLKPGDSTSLQAHSKSAFMCAGHQAHRGWVPVFCRR